MLYDEDQEKTNDFCDPDDLSLDAEIEEVNRSDRNVWTRSLTRNEKSKVLPTSLNVVRILENTVPNGAYLNEFDMRYYWNAGNALGLSGAIKDSDTIKVMKHIESRIPSISENNVWLAILEYAGKTTKHPIREYLNGLTPTDDDWAETWLIRLMNAQDTEYVRRVSKMWLISAIARVMNPGVQVDTTLVLKGSQGVRKSTMFNLLAKAGSKDGYFSDDIGDISNKDAAIGLCGNWIVEFAELDRIKGKALETTKGFLTRRTDKYRPPYGKTNIHVPRQNVFGGTTNEDTFLFDDENRRFWVVDIPSIQMDIEAATKAIDLIWASALHCYQNNECWYFDLSETKRFEKEIEHHKYISPLEEKLDEMDLVGSPDVEDQELTTCEILERIYGVGHAAVMNKSNQMEMSRILKTKGRHKVQITDGRKVWRLIVPKPKPAKPEVKEQVAQFLEEMQLKHEEKKEIKPTDLDQNWVSPEMQ